MSSAEAPCQYGNIFSGQNVACMLLQILTHDGATVKGKSDIMSKLTSIVELHMAFGMSYRTQHVDFTPWHKVWSEGQLQMTCAPVLP